MELVVIKIGGSLLSLPDLCERIGWLRAEFRHARLLFVVGGGEAADLVRGWDRLFELGEERAHWLALEAVRLNEQLFAQLVPDLVGVCEAADLSRLKSDRTAGLLRLIDFLRLREQRGQDSLPHRWSVTTDSIALFAAKVFGAQELVLAKSVDLPDSISYRQAATIDLIDQYFSEIILPAPTTNTAEVPPRIVWINLRSHSLRKQSWVAENTPVEPIKAGS